MKVIGAFLALSIVFVFAWGCGTRTVVGTFRSDSPSNKFHLAIRTAGPIGEPFAGENKKDVRIAFFTLDPEKNAGGATITVTATKPEFQVRWEGDKRITVDIVEPDSVKGTRTLSSAVFVLDEKRQRFKKQ